MSQLSCMPLKDAVQVAKLWLEIGGRPEVELAALEPTLWKDGNLRISELIAALKELKTSSGQSILVTMTTNGSLLSKHAKALAQSGLDKLRISWHTCDPELFADVSGGGNYNLFKEGILAAIEEGLPLSFNRVLLKDYLSDLPKQLDFIERYNLSLKLYDLYWTPEIGEYYSQYYIHWQSVLEKFVLPRTKKMNTISTKLVRGRRVFQLHSGGQVIVKESIPPTRQHEPCSSCPYQKQCLEGFGDYLRVDPDLSAFPCYLRRDFARSLKEIFLEENPARAFQQYVNDIFLLKEESLISEIKLRYIVVPFCNFNCFLPKSSISWCLKKVGNYSYPKRKR